MTTLILSVFFAISASAYDVEVDGICYNLIEKGKVAEVTKSGYFYYSGDIIIPNSITVNNEEYLVTRIGDNAFDNCQSLNSLTIPNSITSIGNSFFPNCI